MSGDSGGAYTLQALITDSVETLHVNNFETDAATTAVDYTGSAGNDTFIMMTTADKIAGGAGTSDTLDVNYAAVLGGISVDLSATGEQISTLDGGAISGSVTGFENVDLSGYTGFGASVTAIKTGSTITGTGSIDRITGGAGADTIKGGAGADVITGGAGNDTFVYAGTAELVAANAAIDAVDGGSGTADAIRLDGASTIAAADLLDRIDNVEQITASATAGALSITATAVAGTFTGTSFDTIDLSGDTNAVGANVVSITAITGITTIKGGAGVETITLGAAAVAATVTPGGGADVLSLGNALGATVVIGTADVGATYATADKITGFTTNVDKLSLGTAGTAANFATANGAATEAAALIAANTALDGTVQYYLATAIVADLGGGAGLESLLFIDQDLDGTADDVIALVGIAGVLDENDIIA